MAQAQLSKVNRRREMECVVCLNRLRQPKILSCAHNFCHECLESLVQNQKIDCPLCRKETTLGAGGVEDLVKNIALINIMDTMCVNCHNDREVLCAYCGKWMCSTCRENCQHQQKFTDDSQNLLKELSKAKKEVNDTRSKLTKNVESRIDQIETRVREMVNNGERLKNEIRQEQNRQLDVLDKLTNTLLELEKTISRTTDKDSLKDKDMLGEAFRIYTSQWSDTLTECTKEISQAYRPIRFIAGNISPTVGKVSIEVDYQNARIEHFTLGSKGSYPGEFSCPTHVASSPVTNNVIVLDTNNNRVQVFNERHQFVSEFGSKGDGEGQFNSDGDFGGLSVTDDGLIVVADTKNQRLQVFTERGKYVRSIGSKGSGPGEFCWCVGLDIHDDLIYVCDDGNNRIQVFEVGGKCVRQFGSRDVFSPLVPIDVTVCPNKDVVVAAGHPKHPDDGKLVVFTADGKHKTTIGNHGNIGSGITPIQLHLPCCVTTDSAGHILVSDWLSSHDNCIHILTPSCKHKLVSIRSETCGLQKMWRPSGFVCTENGDIIVADDFNNNIHVLSFKW